MNYTAEEQFARLLSRTRTDIKTGCIECTRCFGPAGYGVVTRNKKQMLAHRLAWEATHGPVPPGMFVLHSCDNPKCVNPEHLSLGTARDNYIDMVERGRGGWQKLTRVMVDEIRTLFAQGVYYKDILARFKISQSQLYRIRNKERWSHAA